MQQKVNRRNSKRRKSSPKSRRYDTSGTHHILTTHHQSRRYDTSGTHHILTTHHQSRRYDTSGTHHILTTHHHNRRYDMSGTHQQPQNTSTATKHIIRTGGMTCLEHINIHTTHHQNRRHDMSGTHQHPHNTSSEQEARHVWNTSTSTQHIVRTGGMTCLEHINIHTTHHQNRRHDMSGTHQQPHNTSSEQEA